MEAKEPGGCYNGQESSAKFTAANKAGKGCWATRTSVLRRLGKLCDKQQVIGLLCFCWHYNKFKSFVAFILIMRNLKCIMPATLKGFKVARRLGQT